MRYKITIAYDGGAYHGWQKQPHEKMTVQEVVEDAVFSVTGERIIVTASGRTDEGVHALGQVAHFDVQKELPPERYVCALNHYLPPDVRVLDVQSVTADFDARKSAKRKTYAYRMYEGVPNPLRRTRETCVGKVDVEAMHGAASLFVGEHDFAAFRSSGSSAKTTVREIYDSRVERENDSIVFRITGNGFLYNMVRIMAASLIRVGRGEKADIIKSALDVKDRRLVPDVAPSEGLYLEKVEYTEK